MAKGFFDLDPLTTSSSTCMHKISFFLWMTVRSIGCHAISWTSPCVCLALGKKVRDRFHFCQLGKKHSCNLLLTINVREIVFFGYVPVNKFLRVMIPQSVFFHNQVPCPCCPSQSMDRSGILKSNETCEWAWTVAGNSVPIHVIDI